MPTVAEFAHKPHYVYRLFDQFGALLYIGCTVNLATRRAEHRREKPWFPQVASWRISGPYEGVVTGRTAEARAIATERPRYNGDPHKAGRLSWITRRQGVLSLNEEVSA